MDKPPRVFMCNTNRRESFAIGHVPEYLERIMKKNNCAIAWGVHNWVDHTDSVAKGDLILMWAKSVGFVGLGEALGTAKVLGLSKPARVFKEFEVDERQIPVRWLAWVSDFEALYWQPPNCTFLDMNKERYRTIRESAIKHLLERGALDPETDNLQAEEE